MEVQYLILEVGVEHSPQGDAQAPCGWVRAPDQPRRRFDSYVQLIGTLEELRASITTPGEDCSPVGDKDRPSVGDSYPAARRYY